MRIALKLLALLLIFPSLAWAEQGAGVEGQAGEPSKVEEPDSPRLSLHGFHDFTLGVNRTSPLSGSSSTDSAFAIGQVDFFVTSRLASNISMLGEIVFELDDSGEMAADVERLFIKYSIADAFRVSVGRFHTALGYWNEEFHHGRLLQPTVERPEALKFEDDGGILPVHSVGLEFSGDVRAESWTLSYVANVANGRGLTREEVQVGSDANRQKATSLKLSASHDGAYRILFGPMFYRDLIPADPATPGREGAVDERILGGHLVLDQGRLQFLSEYYAIHHEDQFTGSDFRHEARYAVVVLRTGKWKPYVGEDRIHFAPGDPFYAPEDTSLKRHLAGVRLDINPFNALKFEYRREGRAGVTTDVLAIQVAFTF